MVSTSLAGSQRRITRPTRPSSTNDGRRTAQCCPAYMGAGSAKIGVGSETCSLCVSHIETSERLRGAQCSAAWRDFGGDSLVTSSHSSGRGPERSQAVCASEAAPHTGPVPKPSWLFLAVTYTLRQLTSFTTFGSSFILCASPPPPPPTSTPTPTPTSFYFTTTNPRIPQLHYTFGPPL